MLEATKPESQTKGDGFHIVTYGTRHKRGSYHELYIPP